MRVGSNRAEMQLVPESLGLLMDPAAKHHQFGRDGVGSGLAGSHLGDARTR